MARMPAFRRVWIVVAASVAALPALLQPLPVAASPTGTLFGITGPNSNILSRIDPVTGVETQLTDLNVSGALDAQSANLVSDPNTHRLFLIRTVVTNGGMNFDEQLLTVDSQSGVITSNADLATRGPLQDLVVDPTTGTLFGFAFNAGIVRVDPSTGAQTLVAPVPNPTFAVEKMAIAPASHTMYVSLDTVGPGASTQVVAVDIQSGATLTNTTLVRSVRSIAFDTSLGKLFGVTDCCPNDVVQVDPTLGGVNFVAGLGDTIQPYWTAIDPASSTIFVDISTFDPSTLTSIDRLVSINEQSGVTVAEPVVASGVGSMAFETPTAVIMPDSIKADVRTARASGAISNAGITNSLLAKLNAAGDARSRGQCATAANIYNAFIHELKAQSGQHVAATTASQLISEAQFLIANCP